MARKEGLRPIGDSIKKIIEKIQKERQERLKKGKPIRTQPKLPGLKKGGAVEPEYTIKDEVKSRMRKETPRTGYGIGLSPLTHYRRYKHRKDIEKERARDKAKTKMMSGGMAGLFGKRKNAEAGETKPKESNEVKKKKRLEELKKEIDGMKKGGLKSPQPGTYEYYLLNRPKHSPAPIKPKPQKMDKGGKVKKPIKVKKIAIGIGKIKDYPGIKKIIEMNKKGKKRFAEGGMIPKTPKQKKFAALAEPRDKITYADKIAGATGKSKKMKQGGMARGGGAAIRGNNFKGVY